MNSEQKISIFWFRRDLRLDDNVGLYRALKGNHKVLALFIFDKAILDKLDDKTDLRVQFIHQNLRKIKNQLEIWNTSLLIDFGEVVDVFKKLINQYNIHAVFTNHDYEPYGRDRDEKVARLLDGHDVTFHTFKDQVIFEKGEIVKDDGKPYTVFTPYGKKWLGRFHNIDLQDYNIKYLIGNFLSTEPMPWLELPFLGFSETDFQYPTAVVDTDQVIDYHKTRDFPAMDGTSRLGVHLRFGTISIRKLVHRVRHLNSVFLNELIWREFFMMILWYFPETVNQAFKTRYSRISWRNNQEEFTAWTKGTTGYPLVDAGIRQLNATGFMHNRLRMVVATFLVKHLLIDWKWGEAYFAGKLLDYEQASNIGNWQWVAGTGCDAAPYFRIFNPAIQLKKFDKNHKFIRAWIPEFNTPDYPSPMVDHKLARDRAIKVYKQSLSD